MAGPGRWTMPTMPISMVPMWDVHAWDVSRVPLWNNQDSSVFIQGPHSSKFEEVPTNPRIGLRDPVQKNPSNLVIKRIVLLDVPMNLLNEVQSSQVIIVLDGNWWEPIKTHIRLKEHWVVHFLLYFMATNGGMPRFQPRSLQCQKCTPQRKKHVPNDSHQKKKDLFFAGEIVFV